MKKLIGLLLLIPGIVYAKCDETTSREDVKYEVSAKVPEFLKGASIIVVKANGEASKVSAEEFMVVKRKATYVAGQNVNKTLTCSSKYRNNLILEGRRDYTDVSIKESGQTLNVYHEKEFVPGANYYRRELFDTRIGAGVGIDANGTVKGLVGVDF